MLLQKYSGQTGPTEPYEYIKFISRYEQSSLSTNTIVYSGNDDVSNIEID